MNKTLKQFVIRMGLVATLLAVLAVGLASSAAANSGALVRPDPLSLGLKPGDQATVTLLFENVQDLYGVEVHLRFDPSIVEVVDVDAGKPGVQVQAEDWLRDGFVAMNQADNAAGQVDFAVTLLNPAPPVSGSRSFASITFKAKDNGSGPLKIEKAILATRDGQEIQAQWQDGVLGVSPQGQTPDSQAPVAAGQQAADGRSGLLSSPGLLLVGVVGLAVLAVLAALVVVVIVLLMPRRRY